MTLGAYARIEINRLLEAASRHTRDYKAANIHVIKGIAIRELALVEESRAIIQMTSGSRDKTFTAMGFIYRLIKFAGSRRALFPVDRGNHGRKTAKDCDHYVSLVNDYKFGEEYIIQHFTPR